MTHTETTTAEGPSGICVLHTDILSMLGAMETYTVNKPMCV